MSRRVASRACLVLMLATPVCFIGRPLAADGWHNAALSTASLDDWLQDARQVIPDLDTRLKTSTLKAGRGVEDLKRLREQKRDRPAPQANPQAAGGRLETNLTPQQQALLGRKALDCVQVLAYMTRDNIIPREFPQFPLEKIPEYRQAARQLLQAMGDQGTSVVTGHLRAHLMGAGPISNDIDFHPEYFNELLTLLGDAAAAGRLPPEELAALAEATQGRKPRALQKLANDVDATLAKNLRLDSLLRWLDATEDPDRRQLVLDHLRDRVTSATTNELSELIEHPDLDAKTRLAIVNQLRKALPDVGVLGLLRILDSDIDDAIQREALAELEKRRPRYADVQGEIDSIWRLTSSPKQVVADFANWHIQNAFQRAPISDCLTWLGTDDEPFRAVIWKQVEARIERADAGRKDGYGRAALATVGNTETPAPVRLAALGLLGRLRNAEHAEAVVDGLLLLPRELWPAAGEALRQMTGQDFGPRAGDGVAEVVVAVRQWREWLKSR